VCCDARNVYAKEQGGSVASQLKSMEKSGFQKTTRIKGFNVKRCFGLLSMTSEQKGR